jgi:undecaprenyl phosphate-alpha-L-ara4FN deformylase
MMLVGLRVDVDTLRGTRIGVPRLVELLARYDMRASFFFTVGPDNMGRHLWRLLRPAFFSKMVRTRAGRLYGWDIILRGTLWPGPVIGKCCPHAIRKADRAGHEIGLHAWDHHRWQTGVGRWDRHTITTEINKGYTLLSNIMGRAPDGFAAPAWRVTSEALNALDAFQFCFQSDCRGHSLFRPVVQGRRLGRLQVPTTLPTYDELIGRRCKPETYNGYLLSRMRPDGLNVLTIHAEAEGIACHDLFKSFLATAHRKGVVFKPLGEMLTQTETVPDGCIDKRVVAGREGWLACQGDSRGSIEPARKAGK